MQAGGKAQVKRRGASLAEEGRGRHRRHEEGGDLRKDSWYGTKDKGGWWMGGKNRRDRKAKMGRASIKRGIEFIVPLGFQQRMEGGYCAG